MNQYIENKRIVEVADKFIKLENGLRIELSDKSVSHLKRARYFCLINTRKTQEYTYKSISTFAKNTPFRADVDRFYLIDNDVSFDDETWGMIVIKNGLPLTFAQNINQVLKIAIQDKADFVLMSNDIIFTQGWFEPLISNDSIMVPLCNQCIDLETQKFKTTFAMSLSDYLGNEEEVELIAKYVKSLNLKFTQPKLIPYYSFYLPYEVSSEVGLFDENFGRGGGEDIDYRLRANKKGFETKMSSDSWVLHFMGVSTWRSGESNETTQMHNKKYIDYFKEKWGNDIANLMLNADWTSFQINII